MVAEHKTHQVDSFRTSLSVLVDPLKYLVDLPRSFFENTADSLSSNASLQKENASLREAQLIHQTKLLRFEALEKENIRLRALLENSFKLGEQVLVAELLSVNMAPYEHILVVNKGTRFGVHPQQPVLDANGVVGQVFRSQPLSAEIMLITDPNHAIPVQVNRNGVLTIAVGSGQLNRLNLPFLPSNADIRPGDLLITSGLGGTFPRGYPVAVVDQFVSQSNKPFANITATPTALLDRNRELMIVWSKSTPVPLFSKTNASESGSVNPGEAKTPGTPLDGHADSNTANKPGSGPKDVKKPIKPGESPQEAKSAKKPAQANTEVKASGKPADTEIPDKKPEKPDVKRPETPVDEAVPDEPNESHTELESNELLDPGSPEPNLPDPEPISD